MNSEQKTSTENVFENGSEQPVQQENPPVIFQIQ
jgi:hypothetical protein